MNIRLLPEAVEEANDAALWYGNRQSAIGDSVSVMSSSPNCNRRWQQSKNFARDARAGMLFGIA